MQQSINFYAHVSSLLHCAATALSDEGKLACYGRIHELNKHLPNPGDMINIAQSKPNLIIITSVEYGQVVVYPSFSRTIEVQIVGKDMQDYQEVYYLYTELKYEV